MGTASKLVAQLFSLCSPRSQDQQALACLTAVLNGKAFLNQLLLKAGAVQSRAGFTAEEWLELATAHCFLTPAALCLLAAFLATASEGGGSTVALWRRGGDAHYICQPRPASMQALPARRQAAAVIGVLLHACLSGAE